MKNLSCLGIIVLASLAFLVGAIVWPYSLNTWLIFLGKAPVILWWQGGILGMIPAFGQTGLSVAVLTWVLMLFLS